MLKCDTFLKVPLPSRSKGISKVGKSSFGHVGHKSNFQSEPLDKTLYTLEVSL